MLPTLFHALSGLSGEPSVPLLSPAAAAAWGDRVWRADRFAPPSQPAWPTGHPALDAELPGGGWPARGLTELLFKEPGSGEVRLLAPALRERSQGEWLWIAPPYTPYAPALQALGLPLARLIWIAPPTPADAAWAAEQALRARCCAGVLWWGDAVPPMLRRLHLAAQEGGSPLFALRPWGVQRQSSPAPLRLACEAAPQGLLVDVFKRRGPGMAVALHLSLPLPITLQANAPARQVPGSSSHVVVRPAPALAAA